jgi:hypothetical protein
MAINRVVDVGLDHRAASQRPSLRGLRRIVVLIHRVMRVDGNDWRGHFQPGAILQVDGNGWHGHFQRGFRRR